MSVSRSGKARAFELFRCALAHSCLRSSQRLVDIVSFLMSFVYSRGSVCPRVSASSLSPRSCHARLDAEGGHSSSFRSVSFDPARERRLWYTRLHLLARYGCALLPPQHPFRRAARCDASASRTDAKTTKQKSVYYRRSGPPISRVCACLPDRLPTIFEFSLISAPFFSIAAVGLVFVVLRGASLVRLCAMRVETQLFPRFTSFFLSSDVTEQRINR